MQTLSANLKAALIDIDATVAPRTLVDLYEFYSSDYIPGVNGFDPDDAVESFAAVEITWNGNAYRREVISRGDITRNMGEKTNQVTLTFSNISRYMATLAQSQTMEGLFCVIRTVVPSVTDDSLVLFVGRLDKPSDIDKQTFTVSARQDFGNINQTLPPDKFTADDPEGRLPSDPLFEGFNFIPIAGSNSFPVVEPSTSFFGRLFGRRKTVTHTEQWSSADGTPYGEVVREILGRVQVQLIPIAWADKGLFVTYLLAASKGPIAAIENIKSRTDGFSDPFNLPGPIGPVVHLGDAGGTGTNLGNTNQADLGGGSKFSYLAYIEGASTGSASDQTDSPPTVTAIVVGRIVPLPNGSGVYSLNGWTDNPVHLSRFVLTSEKWVNIDPGFMEDSVNYQTALHCDFPLIDDTNSQLIIVHSADLPQAGTAFARFRSTGILSPRFFRYGEVDPVGIDGPYIPWEPGDPIPPELPGPTPTFIQQTILRKRYTANCPISDEVRAPDFLYKTLFPAAKLFVRVNKKGKYEIRSEKPSDATRIRSATAVDATSIPVLDVTPWKSGADLLTGRVVLGFGLDTSEVRTVSSADYSTSGNSVTLVASASGGGVTATASGASLSGGSTTVQASGTVTIGGTPAVGNSVTVTIDGIAIIHTLDSDDTTGTVAAMIAAHINATPRLSKYILAIWDSGTPTIVTIKCLHGALNVTPALLKVHDGPIADPTVAPTIAAAASGILAAGTYKVAYANVNSNGLTSLTPIASVVLTANQKIDVSGLPAFPAGVTSRQFFISQTTGSTNLRYHSTRADAANFSINSLPLNGAALPPSYNTTAEELIRVAMSFATNSQDIFPVWPTSTAVILNDIYLPTVPNGHKYQVTTAGTTGATEPSWPTGVGATVASGTAVFTEIGSTVLQQAGLTRANIKKDSFRYPLGSRQSSVNQIKGNFRDARNDFALTPFKVNDRTRQLQVKKTYPLELDLSAVDNTHQMERIANWALSKHCEGDWFNTLATGPSGLVLEEGDVICSSDDSGGLINVVTRIEELRIHPNHDVTVGQARKYSTLMFSDDVGAHSIPIPSTLRFTQTADSIIEFIDNHAIRDADGLIPGMYVSVSRDLAIDGDWRGWALYADYGDGYEFVIEGDIPAVIGEATTTLATPVDPYVFDHRSSLTFTLQYGADVEEFTSCTEDELLANSRRNLFLVKDEYLQAATITDNGSRSYTITDLLRGRFGTDATELTHGATERVVYLNGAETLVPVDLALLNQEVSYKVVTTNQDVADAIAIPFTWTGGTVRPYSTINHKGILDSGNDKLIEFEGRTRLGGGLRSFQAGAVNEEVEEYRVQPVGTDRILTVIPGMQLAAVLQSSEGAFEGCNHNTFDPFVDSTIFATARTYQEIHQPGNFLEGTLQLSITGGGLVVIGLQSTGGEWVDLTSDLIADKGSGGLGATLIGTLATFPYLVILDAHGSGGGPFWQQLHVYEYGTRIFSASDESGESDYDPDFGWMAITSGPVFFRIRFNFIGSSVRIQKAHTLSVPFTTIATGNVASTFPVFGVVGANGVNNPDKVIGVMMTCNPFPKTIYSAAQQTEDAFTPGDPIEFDIWQHSVLVPGPKSRVLL